MGTVAAIEFENFDNLRELISRLESGEDKYSFYGVMLYAPSNGLDGRLHRYVLDHWGYLHHLTGDITLLMALERLGSERSLESFKPEEIYDIARYLGVPADQLPALAIFTNPSRRQEIRVLNLREFLVPADELTDEAITDFFRSLVTAIDRCAESDQRLRCLDEGLRQQWPPQSQWKDRVDGAGEIVTASASSGNSVLGALHQILGIFAT